MGQIQKGFALTIAICGVVYLVCGLISSICGWILASNLNDSFSFTSYSVSSADNIQFGIYWWGGCSLFIPAILGIVAACTKNICAMVAFLIFNIIGMLAAIACTIYVAFILVIWMPLATMIKENRCVTLMDTCSCFDKSVKYYQTSATCEKMTSVESLLFGIIIGVAFSGFVAFISSYVSCCALCNTEQGSLGMVIQQPPAMVVVANTQFNQNSQNLPQQPYYFTQHMPYGGGAPIYPHGPVASYDNFTTNDKVTLIDNRIV